MRAAMTASGRIHFQGEERFNRRLDPHHDLAPPETGISSKAPDAPKPRGGPPPSAIPSARTEAHQPPDVQPAAFDLPTPGSRGPRERRGPAGSGAEFFPIPAAPATSRRCRPLLPEDLLRSSAPPGKEILRRAPPAKADHQPPSGFRTEAALRIISRISVRPGRRALLTSPPRIAGNAAPSAAFVLEESSPMNLPSIPTISSPNSFRSASRMFSAMSRPSFLRSDG